MIELQRSVKLIVNPGGEGAGSNGHAGRPSMVGLGRQYQVDAVCAGTPDADTGYLIGIQEIDRAVRQRALPVLTAACRERPETEPWALVGELAEAVARGVPVPLRRLRLRLTPTYSVEVEMDSRTRVGPAALVRQRFEFAAAHRLHADALSDDENRRVFGKCNNPSGHGHNYEVEVAVEIPTGETRLSLHRLETLVDRVLIDPFDHTHLNEDTEAFSAETGVIPSVENIARVFFERLAGPTEAELEGARLRSVTVWETPRTSATFPAS
ncbi:MAG: 6-carboxytetrahydropterin synthase [Planctomycetota bacterium]